MKKHATFWLVWAIALIPVFAAFISFSGGPWQPEGRTNQGQLLPSGETLETVRLLNQQGKPYQANGRWRLFLLQNHGCSETCAQWQQLLPNIHTAMGRDQERLQWHRVIHQDIEEGQLLLADPMGNLVTRYRLDQPPQAVLKDLKRLLRVSKVG